MSEEGPSYKAVLERVGEVATLAGIRGRIDDKGDRFEAGFNFKDGRSQMVYVRPINTPGGVGVCVYSPAAIYKKGLLGGISGKDAIELLRRNENLHFARYGIREFDDKVVVVASVDLLLETMDPSELAAAFGSTSVAADAWEERTGKDTF